MMISSVPVVVQPIPEVSPASHKISRFALSIADTKVPKCFQTPTMKPYDGTTNLKSTYHNTKKGWESLPFNCT